MPLFTTKPRPRIRLTIVPALLTFCFLPPFADRAPAQRTDRWTAGPIVRDSPDNWAPVRGTDRWTVGPIVKDPPEDRASSRPVEGQAQVHVLLLIDTHAHKIGNGADASGRNMENVLQAAFAARPHRLRIKKLSGRYATRQNVLSYYQNLHIRPNDTVMAYYFGHGATDRNAGHFLAMRYGHLFRHELRDAMLEHGPRLAVLLTECCANYVQALRGAAAMGGGDEESLSRGEVLNHLLLKHRGVVNITASKIGKYAFTTSKGGIFNFALTRLIEDPPQKLDRNHDGRVDWNEFYAQLRAETNAVFHWHKDRAGPDSAFNRQASQIPFAFELSAAWSNSRTDPPVQVYVDRRAPVEQDPVFVDRREPPSEDSRHRERPPSFPSGPYDGDIIPVYVDRPGPPSSPRRPDMIYID